jgi:hypothetical protein
LTQLLQGDVYDRTAAPILKQMESEIRAVATNPAHPWHRHFCAELARAENRQEDSERV